MSFLPTGLPASRAGLALAFALLAASAWLAAPAGAQVSPGPLAQPHREFDGNRSCFQCHPPAGARDRMDDRCLACHVEIGAMRAGKRGLHAKVADRACAKCHPDHGGSDFHLVEFEEGSPEKFDHSRAGYALEGAHARVECRACHQPKHQRGAVVANMKVKDHTRSWLGLETACASCHADPHRGELGVDCMKCHAMTAWKPASRFDHAATSYPLTGRHAKVACAKCHLPLAVAGATTVEPGASGAAPTATVALRWKPVAHGECSSCHADPHKGRFGAECARCHRTDDFHAMQSGTFDHDRTRYPLRGAHAKVECASCHDPVRAWGRKPAFATCGGCHQDAHAGQLTPAGSVRDCAVCHGVAGFTPSLFALADHQLTDYPLEGAHKTAPCSGCHGKAPESARANLGSARVPMHPSSAECTDCHRDPHKGRLTRAGKRSGNGKCIECHDMDRFSPSRMDVAAHMRCDFPLTGAHRATPCATCHAEIDALLKRGAARGPATLKAAGGPALEFADPRRVCADCHRTPHGKQFERRKDRGACEGCHGVDSFAPAVRFDHNRDASYHLDGAHAKVPCASCHPTVREGGATRVVYRPVSSRCESCHATR